MRKHATTPVKRATRTVARNGIPAMTKHSLMQRKTKAETVNIRPLSNHFTSSLDSETEEKIQKALDKLTLNKTTVVIAHRLSTILNSDKIYVIDNGAVIDEGNHQELIKGSKIYKNFYEKQIRKD